MAFPSTRPSICQRLDKRAHAAASKPSVARPPNPPAPPPRKSSNLDPRHHQRHQRRHLLQKLHRVRRSPRLPPSRHRLRRHPPHLRTGTHPIPIAARHPHPHRRIALCRVGSRRDSGTSRSAARQVMTNPRWLQLRSDRLGLFRYPAIAGQTQGLSLQARGGSRTHAGRATQGGRAWPAEGGATSMRRVDARCPPAALPPTAMVASDDRYRGLCRPPPSRGKGAGHFRAGVVPGKAQPPPRWCTQTVHLSNGRWWFIQARAPGSPSSERGRKCASLAMSVSSAMIWLAVVSRETPITAVGRMQPRARTSRSPVDGRAARSRVGSWRAQTSMSAGSADPGRSVWFCVKLGTPCSLERRCRS